ncbi:EAL domain-containing protein [Romboutsia lituseburensis]|uniref:EAL domain-containing protein n=1 Tax=Romboutsia lituseburensis TaxID=1537 RepID=UPI00215A668B|nr:EAL domain-containing protein [Romboutsia lituseburensis]MCR8745051.1 EAL domain-containing protein [Romboutsia lituseburensis]
MKNSGISFVLEDFGTGYSSLSYILNMPIDIIKVDKSFIINIENDNKSKNILDLIVQMSNKLNLDINKFLKENI